MTNKTFAKIFSEAIASSGCSLNQIAARLQQRGFKTNRSTLKHWRDGKHEPSIKRVEVLRYLPEAMGLSSDEAAAFLSAISVALGFPITQVTQEQSATAVFPQRHHFGAGSLPPFAGRHKELARLQDLIRNQQSVVIIGLGGMGKTRLTQELLQTMAGDFAHGCEYLKIISKEQDSLQLLRHVARLLGINIDPALFNHHSRQLVLQQMRTQLQGVRLLFFVDNVERVGQVHDLVRGLPTITWVFTTRNMNMTLKSIGVHAIRLKLPPPVEAVQIFQTHIEDVAISDLDNLPLVQEVVEKAGRLPLALRLVAVRLRNGIVSSVAELNQWLAQGGLLRGHPHSLKPQELFKQTLESMPLEAREVFAICGAFANPRIKMVHLRSISDQVGIKSSPDQWELLGDYSLVDFPDEEHIEMHPLLHDFARSRLKASSKYLLVCNKFQEYYLEVAESVAQMDETQRDYWQLLPEEKNLLTVVESFYQAQDWTRLYRIWPAVSGYLWNTGNYTAYEAFDRQCLQAAQTIADDNWRARLLSELGYVKWEVEAWAEADELFNRSQAIHDAISDQLLAQARLRRYRAQLAMSHGELDTADSLLAEAETRLSQLTNPPETHLETAWLLLYSMKMSVFLKRGEWEKAEAAGRAANHLYQSLTAEGGGHRLVEFKVELGDALFHQGKVDAARQFWQEMLEQDGLPLLLPKHAEAHMRLAWLDAQEGKWESATTMAGSAQQIFTRHGKFTRCFQMDELISRIESRADLPAFTELFA